MKKGFTLIELLAVIIIISFVILLTMPTILNVISTVKIKSIISSIQSFNDTIENGLVQRELGSISFPEEIEDNCYSIKKLNKIILLKGTIPSNGIVCIDPEIRQVSSIDATYQNKELKYTGLNGKIKLGDEIIGYLKKDNKIITFYINGFSYTTTKGTTWCEYAKEINSNVNCLDNTYFNEGIKMNLNYNYICSDNVCSLENAVKNNDKIKEDNYYSGQIDGYN